MLRLWVRLHARPMPPGVDDVAREVHTYALAAAAAGRTVDGRRRRRGERKRLGDY